MNCTRWREQASDYIEGSLPAEAAAAMREHARSCADCRADESALRAISRELNVLPQVDPPMFFRENVLSAVERQSTRPVYADGRGAPSPWAEAFARIGRLALGTTLAGSAAAAALYFALAPGQSGRGPMVAEVVGTRAAGVLPYGGENADSNEEEAAPRLVVSRKQVELPDGSGPAFDFTLRLENADHGTARFNLLGDARAYRFPEIRQGQPQTLQVPFAAADVSGTISLVGSWTGGGRSHTKYLFVPVPSSEGGRVQEERQSFGLPRMTIPEAAREIAARYGRPVTLEDVPAQAQVELIARGDTASSVLRNGLAQHGLRVAASPSGILVSPAPAAPSPSATPGAPAR